MGNLANLEWLILSNNRLTGWMPPTLGSPAQGYAKVEKVDGDAPFYAYGIINDNFNSDGSFVFPVTESSLVGTSGQTLPVIIETGNFQSELTVTNFSTSEKTVKFSFVADAVQAGDDTAEFSLMLKAISQGYVQIRKTLGNNPFVTYGVINDGGRRGERSGDGAYLPAAE